ncbi:MAG: PKD domain-containing protein [Prolixibacteraceae bacterium]
MREWVSDTYEEAFNGSIIAISDYVVGDPLSSVDYEMKPFLFPSQPILIAGKKYVFELKDGLTLTNLDCSYTNGEAYTSNAGINSDLKFEVHLCSVKNDLPVANAGIDQIQNSGAGVALNGLSSYDPNEDKLTYNWISSNGITLDANSISNPTFTAPVVIQDTPFTFSLIVNDGFIDSEVDQVTVIIKGTNHAPVANSGIDQFVDEGTTVSLNGSLSYDPDGNSLTYKWIAPYGITISSTNVAMPSFKVPEVKKDSILIFSLIVNDGIIDSSPSLVRVNIQNVIKVGINDVYKSALMVFPNPTTGIITIKGLAITQKNEIVIQSVDGKLIQTKSTSSETETIDIGDQAPGTYLLVINNQTIKFRRNSDSN